MIDREKNGMARLLQELKKVSVLRLMNQDGVLTRTLKTMRDLETKTKTKTATYHGRIPLVL